MEGNRGLNLCTLVKTNGNRGQRMVSGWPKFDGPLWTSLGDCKCRNDKHAGPEHNKQERKEEISALPFGLHTALGMLLEVLHVLQLDCILFGSFLAKAPHSVSSLTQAWTGGGPGCECLSTTNIFRGMPHSLCVEREGGDEGTL